MCEFLGNCSLASQVGPFFTSQLLKYDGEKYEHNTYQHLEYRPLINARAHPLRLPGRGGDDDTASVIQNVEFRQQWQHFLTYLTYRSASVTTLPPEHQVAAAYYLLLQGRVDEASVLVDRVAPHFAAPEEEQRGDGERKETAADATAAPTHPPSAMEQALTVQFHYLQAYLDFFSDGPPAVAAKMAARYHDYPITHKRKEFRTIAHQLADATRTMDVDISGDAGTVDGKEHKRARKTKQQSEKKTERKEPESHDADVDRDRDMSELTKHAPALDFAVVNATDGAPHIDLTYQNVNTCSIHFYVLDVRAWFTSKRAFVKDHETAAMMIAPNHSLQVKLPRGGTESVRIPDQFRNANVYIEVVGKPVCFVFSLAPTIDRVCVCV